MKLRYRLFQRRSGIFFVEDRVTGKQQSLKTRDRHAGFPALTVRTLHYPPCQEGGLHSDALRFRPESPYSFTVSYFIGAFIRAMPSLGWLERPIRLG